MIDGLLIFYPLTGIPYVRGDYTRNIDLCLPTFDKSIVISLGASDFIIGGYCLFAFILPFRQYIKLENKQRSQTNMDSDNLAFVARRIIVYSTIMIVTTMIATIIAAIYSRTAGIIP